MFGKKTPSPAEPYTCEASRDGGQTWRGAQTAATGAQAIAAIQSADHVETNGNTVTTHATSGLIRRWTAADR